MTAPSDVWVQLTSANSSSERRLPLSWTLAVLKARLEPITGIPRSSQRLILRRGGDGVVPANEDGDDGRAAHTGQVIEAPDEDDTTLEHFRLTKGCEIYVCMARAWWVRDSVLAPLGLGIEFVWMRCILDATCLCCDHCLKVLAPSLSWYRSGGRCGPHINCQTCTADHVMADARLQRELFPWFPIRCFSILHSFDQIYNELNDCQLGPD